MVAVTVLKETFEVNKREYNRWCHDDELQDPKDYIRWIEHKILEDFTIDVLSRTDVNSEEERAKAHLVFAHLGLTCTGDHFSEGLVERYAALAVVVPLMVDIRSAQPLHHPQVQIWF